MLLKRLTECLFKAAVCLLALLTLIYFMLFLLIEETYMNYILKESNISAGNINNLLRKELDALPWDFVEQRKSEQLCWNSSCALYPNLLQLKFHNKNWQTYKNAEVQMRIYGAYFDKRASLTHRPAIRLLAFINQPHEVRVKNYCQIWFKEHAQPTIADIESYKMLWTIEWSIPWLHLVPYLMTCILPEHKKELIPQAVSVVAAFCENATNNFRVIYEVLPTHKTRAKFAICVKGFSFPYTDLSTVLIEWLELMRMFGVDKVYLNILQIHPNISKVVDYYEEQDFVQSRTTTLAHFANGLPHSQQFALAYYLQNRRYHEMMQYNDCFYRNIYKYEFIVIMDIDEIIMPLTPYENWLEVLQTQLESDCNGNIDAFCFRHAHFPLNLPIGMGVPPLQFLRHLKRHEKYSALGYYTKCWHNTTSVLAVHNHLPFYFVDKQFCKTFVKTSVAQLQHYRYVVKDNQNLGELITDDNILRFKETLISRSFQVFNDLGYFTEGWVDKFKLEELKNKSENLD